MTNFPTFEKEQKFNLFLDDERYPPDNSGGWLIFRNSDEALAYIQKYGLPNFMSLDHDLGENQKTGYDFIKELINYCIENNLFFDCGYYVHSQNPVGKVNIEKYIENYLKIFT
jgi:hypothetical protein